MFESLHTDRLQIDVLTTEDAEFILELVNMPEWIRFIGQRNISNTEEATVYIQKIINNPRVRYWTVRLNPEKTPIGIITFMKRDYLDNYDLGFAFLLSYTGKGYAFESCQAILHLMLKNKEHSKIMATTLKENTNSIQLLEKLGFQFDKEIENAGECVCILY